MAKLLGGSRIYGNAVVDGGLGVGNISIANSTASTSTTTGALVVTGGVGVGDNVSIGGNLTVSGAARRIFGDFSNGTINSRLAFQDATTNNGTFITILPNGTSQFSSFQTYNNSTPTNASYGLLGFVVNNEVSLASAVRGSGTYLPLTFRTRDSERVRIDTNGNVLIGTANALASSNVTIAHTTPSTSTITGALVVAGGAGVAGNLVATTIYGNIGGGSTLANVYLTGSLIPTANVTFDLGTPTQKFRSAYFSGTTIYIGQESLSVDNDGNWVFSSNGGNVSLGSTIEFNQPSANISGNLKANNVTITNELSINSGNLATAIVNSGAAGTGNIGASGAGFDTVFARATSAQYADLAEIYTSDRDYVPGTVLIFGGEKEVTVSTESHDPRVAGVVSTTPAYLMNNSCDGVEVALQGRVPCKVVGPVSKGDRLVTSSTQGAAQRLSMSYYQPGCIIGKSLEDIADDSIQTIEIVVGRV